MEEPMSDVINSLKEILGSYDQKTEPITEEEIQAASHKWWKFDLAISYTLLSSKSILLGNQRFL
jgi:hypothetical protein